MPARLSRNAAFGPSFIQAVRFETRSGQAYALTEPRPAKVTIARLVISKMGKGRITQLPTVFHPEGSHATRFLGGHCPIKFPSFRSA